MAGWRARGGPLSSSALGSEVTFFWGPMEASRPPPFTVPGVFGTPCPRCQPHTREHRGPAAPRLFSPVRPEARGVQELGGGAEVLGEDTEARHPGARPWPPGRALSPPPHPACSRLVQDRGLTTVSAGQRPPACGPPHWGHSAPAPGCWPSRPASCRPSRSSCRRRLAPSPLTLEPQAPELAASSLRPLWRSSSPPSAAQRGRSSCRPLSLCPFPVEPPPPARQASGCDAPRHDLCRLSHVLRCPHRGCQHLLVSDQRQN